jgi:hypothetical protein
MGLLTVVVHIVVAEDHVNVVAVLVLDVQVRQGGAVGDELWRLVQVDAFYPCLSPTCALMPSAEIVYRPSSPGPGAWQSRVMAAAFATVATKSNENLMLTYTDLTWLVEDRPERSWLEPGIKLTFPAVLGAVLALILHGVSSCCS